MEKYYSGLGSDFGCGYRDGFDTGKNFNHQSLETLNFKRLRRLNVSKPETEPLEFETEYWVASTR